jgi:hypothetical protein
MFLIACSSTATPDTGSSSGNLSSSGSTSGGSSTSGGDAVQNCVPRCNAIVSACGGGADQGYCTSLCSTSTEAELKCMEQAGCNRAKITACMTTSGSSSTGGSGTSGSSSGGAPKKVGEACTCDAVPGATTGIYKGCLGNNSACFSTSLYCIAESKSGNGTCRTTCASKDKGKACPTGGACSQSGYKALDGSFWFICE